MPNRLSRFTSSLKQLGEIQVTEWDFMDLLNKDVSDLEIRRSLKRLGDLRVMEWDFRTMLPAMSKLGQQEVDLGSLLRRTAHYRVIEWDFRSALPGEPKSTQTSAEAYGPGAEEMQAVMVRLKSFLQYVALQLIDEPGQAQIKVREIAPNVLRFRLVLLKRDVALLVGREGHTASAIRNILKAAAGLRGVHALLVIHTHEEEMAYTVDDQRGDPE